MATTFEKTFVQAIGLMSGTSLDGVDAALIETDGVSVHAFGEALTLPMPQGLRQDLNALMQGRGDTLAVERALTLLHAEAVKMLLRQADIPAERIAVIGFHGQTIMHRPDESLTWQLGNGALLAQVTGIDTVCDFRRADIAAGGQGAPLVPLFHQALVKDVPKPAAFLNIGGVANVTWVGEESLLAFDTGPGNAMLNDWCMLHTGQAFDEDGKIALSGRADMQRIDAFLRDDYFAAPPPKSLDRNHFSLEPFKALSVAGGAATLAECMAAAVEKAQGHFPALPRCWYVCGGGRHNPAIMAALRSRLNKVEKVEALGLDGDALEAQAFAYLAVRSVKRLPFSLPSTTGATRAVTGGAFYPASCASG